MNGGGMSWTVSGIRPSLSASQTTAQLSDTNSSIALTCTVVKARRRRASLANRQKVSDKFSRRDISLKKPEERERYDRKNGAFNLNTKTQSVKLHEQSRMLSMALSALTQPSCHQLPSHPRYL